MRCPDCDAAQLVRDHTGALVCSACGTLADPAQAVLADSDALQATPSHAAPRTTKGWHLAQTKQDRDRRNTIAMRTFINAVLARLSYPGLAPRAEAVFAQAMAKGNYKWGRKAKLTAGASIAIALREAHKSDLFHDIAFLLDDSLVSLSRAFRSVVSLLGFPFAPTDPAAHLPVLQAHLHAIIHPEVVSPRQLSQSLVSVLARLPLQAAVRTATSLSHVISQHSPPLLLANLPTPPTACALLILGLEAEARAPLPHLGELTRTLASRFALAPGVVSSRYKILYDQIEERIRHVPWLDQFVYKGKGRGAAARSKVPKRNIVAKGIKDVIQFHQEIRLSRLQNQQKIDLELELDPCDVTDEEYEGDGDNDSLNAPMVASSSTTIEKVVTAPPGKRRRVEKKGNAMPTCRFLRDPLSYDALGAATSNGEVGEVSLSSYLLTCSPDQLSRTRGITPTRLQLLAAARGGSTAEQIADEELFADGELEGLLRDEREREALWPLFQLNWGEEISRQEAASDHKSVVSEPKRGAKRIDMDALSRLLGDHVDGDSTDDEGSGSSREGAELVHDPSPSSPDVGDIYGMFHNMPEEGYD